MKAEEKEKVFNKIYNNTFYNLRMYIRRRSINIFIIDDILQEVYLEAFRHIDVLQIHENSVGWIYKTAENKIKKLNSFYTKYAIHEIAYDKTVESVSDEDIELNYIVYEEYRKILLEDEYDLLIKKYVDGYSNLDLALMTGNTVAGSKMRISRIVKKLKKILKTYVFFSFW